MRASMPAKMVRVHELTMLTAASMLDVDRGNVSDWIKAYDSKGLDGLVDDARPGRPRHCGSIPTHSILQV